MATSWLPSASDVPIDRGMGVKLPNVPPDVNGSRANGANAFLINPANEHIGMWVNEITADFQLAGSTAQAALRRDFYPHNFTQPKLTIRGQTTNNYEYNRLADYIRQSQLDALNMNPDSFIVRFVVAANTATVKQPRRPIMRGQHGQISIAGFFASTRKGAMRFVTAHEYELEFVVLAANKFLGLQDNVSIPYLTQQTITQRMEAGRPRVTKIDPSKKGTDPSSSSASPQDDPAPQVKPANSWLPDTADSNSPLAPGLDNIGPFQDTGTSDIP